MARPTDLTPELQAKFIQLLELGNYPEPVANSLGLEASTYYRWMRRGKNGDEPYCQFRKLVIEARGTGETKLLEILRKAAEKDARWAAWMLENTRSKRYHRQTDQRVKQVKDPEKLPDAEFAKEARKQAQELVRMADEIEAKASEAVKH